MHQVSPHNLRDRWNVEKILLDSRVWSVVQKWIKEKCKLILPTVKGAACTFVNRVVLSPSNQCMIFSGRGSRDENVTSYVRLCLHTMQRELRRNALWFHEERLKTLNRVENFRVGHHMISFDRFWILSRCLLDSFGTTLRCQRSRLRYIDIHQPYRHWQLSRQHLFLTTNSNEYSNLKSRGHLFWKSPISPNFPNNSVPQPNFNQNINQQNPFVSQPVIPNFSDSIIQSWPTNKQTSASFYPG